MLGRVFKQENRAGKGEEVKDIKGNDIEVGQLLIDNDGYFSRVLVVEEKAIQCTGRTQNDEYIQTEDFVKFAGIHVHYEKDITENGFEIYAGKG